MKSEEPSGRVKPIRSVHFQDTQDSQEPLARCTSYFIDSNVKLLARSPMTSPEAAFASLLQAVSDVRTDMMQGQPQTPNDRTAHT